MRVSHDKFVFLFTVLEDCEQSLKIQADGEDLLGGAFILMKLRRVPQPLKPLGELLGLGQRVIELIGSEHRAHGVHHLADLPELAVEAGAARLTDLADYRSRGWGDDVTSSPCATNVGGTGWGTSLNLI